MRSRKANCILSICSFHILFRLITPSLRQLPLLFSATAFITFPCICLYTRVFLMTQSCLLDLRRKPPNNATFCTILQLPPLPLILLLVLLWIVVFYVLFRLTPCWLEWKENETWTCAHDFGSPPIHFFFISVWCYTVNYINVMRRQ